MIFVARKSANRLLTKITFRFSGRALLIPRHERRITFSPLSRKDIRCAYISKLNEINLIVKRIMFDREDSGFFFIYYRAKWLLGFRRNLNEFLRTENIKFVRGKSSWLNRKTRTDPREDSVLRWTEKPRSESYSFDIPAMKLKTKNLLAFNGIGLGRNAGFISPYRPSSTRNDTLFLSRGNRNKVSVTGGGLKDLRVNDSSTL